MDTPKRRDVTYLKRTMRRTTLIMVHDVHAQEPRKCSKMGTQNICIIEAFSFRENRAYREQRKIQVIQRAQTRSTSAPKLPSISETDNDLAPMALSKTAKKWLTQNRVESFLWVVKASPDEELEKVAQKIDLEEITEDAIRAVIGLPEGGLFSIENPSPETLTKFLANTPSPTKHTRHKAAKMPCFQK